LGTWLWANVMGKHRIQSAPHPDGGWDWSCSCGVKGHSGDQRDHWAEVGIRDLNRRGGSVQFTPEVERIRRKAIFAALDREIKRGKQ
jgi:hypothetical protein